MKLRLSAAQDEFIQSESIKIQVDIENTTASTISVPDPEANTNNQPVYEITGPDSYGARSISFGEATNPEQNYQDPYMVELAPDATLSRILPINSLLGASPEGEYTIQAKLSLDSSTVTSNSFKFSISEPVFSHRALAFEEGNFSSFPIIVQLLESAGRVYTATFSYDQQHVHTDLFAIDHYVNVGPDVTSIYESLLSHAELDPPTIRTLWAKPGTIGVTDFGSNEPLTIDIDTNAKIPAASLIDKNGVLETVVVEDDTLTMIRFPANPMFAFGGDANATQAQRHWSKHLEKPVSAMVSTISSEAAGSLRAVVLISERAHGASLTMMVWDDGGNLNEEQTVDLDALHISENASFSAFIDNNRRLHVAGVLYKPDSINDDTRSIPSLQMMLMEAELELGKDKDAVISVTPLLRLDELPKATLAKYSDLPSKNRQLTWLLLTERATILTENSSEEGMQLNYSPDIPLRIIDGEESSFILTKRTNGIPNFESFR